MFVVYWTVYYGSDDNETLSAARSKSFELTEMSLALKYCEELRQQKLERPHTIGYITFCSENPNSVGIPGADDVKPGYNWKKRRD